MGYFISITRAVDAPVPTSSLTEYLPAGTAERSSTTERGDITPAAPFSCQRMLSGDAFGTMRKTRKARRNRLSFTGVMVSVTGNALSAGLLPYISQNNPT